MDPLGFASKTSTSSEDGGQETKAERSMCPSAARRQGFAGPQGLKDLLLSRPDAFVKATFITVDDVRARASWIT
jgi:hypothetical protein